LKKTLGKEALCLVSKKTPVKETLCRVSKIKHSANDFFAKCFFTEGFFCLALGKQHLCRVPERKHSANHLALGKEPNYGSECRCC
jgi:hypothetical protein